MWVIIIGFVMYNLLGEVAVEVKRTNDGPESREVQATGQRRVLLNLETTADLAEDRERNAAKLGIVDDGNVLVDAGEGRGRDV